MDGGETVAVVYRHSDGYPDGPCGIVADLARFLNWLTGEPEPRPISDLEYAAANWVFWNKSRLGEIRDGAEKLGIGICPTTTDHIHWDCEYLYTFDGERLSVSEHVRCDEEPDSWDSIRWQFEGTLADALKQFAVSQH